jgi:hypothetical protein
MSGEVAVHCADRYRLDSADIANKCETMQVADDKSLETQRGIAHVSKAQLLN